MHIVIDDKIPFIRGVFEPFAEVEYVDGANISSEHLKNVQALVIRTRTRCDAKLLKGTSVKYIATATIGYDHIDAEYCKLNNILWSNAAGCNSGAVTQYVATALLYMADQRKILLSGKTIGVVGVGNVGKHILNLARALDMHALQNDPPRQKEEMDFSTFTPLASLIQQSDVITLHTLLEMDGIDKTYHLASDEFFSNIQSPIILINTSRGEVVDEKALWKALAKKKVESAALDVWENEPFLDKELLKNVTIGTPHIAGYSAEGKIMATQMSVRSIADFFNIEPLKEWTHKVLPKPKDEHFSIDCISLDPQQVMLKAMVHTFNIKADSDALRSAPHSGEFLRGKYEYRREPSAYTVTLINPSPEHVRPLTLLGFNVKTN
jgi:erythronate-4-phosphate dehydrogenase